jgi:hypothetical protein
VGCMRNFMVAESTEALWRCCGGAAVPRRMAIGGRRRVRVAAGSQPGGGVAVPRRLDGGGRRRVGVPVVRVGAGLVSCGRRGDDASLWGWSGGRSYTVRTPTNQYPFSRCCLCPNRTPSRTGRTGAGCRRRRCWRYGTGAGGGLARLGVGRWRWEALRRPCGAGQGVAVTAGTCARWW